MKRHALEIVRSAIAFRVDTRRRGVRCGADAEHDSPPRCVTRGRVRSCLRDPLPATSKFEEALKLARFSEVALDPLE